MTLTIEATYENGVFVPDQRLDLADHERVRLTVERPTAPTALEIVRSRRGNRIQIDPDDARAIASSPEFLPEEAWWDAAISLDLPDGHRCFVDANIFYYHLVETPLLSEPWTTFLERAASGRLEIYTSLHVLSETIHKVMLAEAEQRFRRGRAGLVSWLQRNRHRISELSEFQQAAVELDGMGLRLLPTDTSDLVAAGLLSAQFGLLTNDAVIVALMSRHALSDLVTNDDDFDGIPGLQIWKPR